MSAKYVCKCGQSMQTFSFVGKLCRHANIGLYDMYIYKGIFYVLLYIITFAYFLQNA